MPTDILSRTLLLAENDGAPASGVKPDARRQAAARWPVFTMGCDPHCQRSRARGRFPNVLRGAHGDSYAGRQYSQPLYVLMAWWADPLGGDCIAAKPSANLMLARETGSRRSEMAFAGSHGRGDDFGDRQLWRRRACCIR